MLYGGVGKTTDKTKNDDILVVNKLSKSALFQNGGFEKKQTPESPHHIPDLDDLSTFPRTHRKTIW